MCDRIKEDSDKYQDAVKVVEKSGCATEHVSLAKWLEDNNRDWTLWQSQLHELKQCFAEVQKERSNDY